MHQDLPETVIQTYVGRAKYDRVMAAAADDAFFIGKRAEEMRGILRLASVPPPSRSPPPVTPVPSCPASA